MYHPTAVIDDGLLDVYVMGVVGKCKMIKFFDEIDNDGAHIYRDELKWTRSKKCRWEFKGDFNI